MLAWFGCCGGVILVPLLIWIFFRSAITAGVKVAAKGKQPQAETRPPHPETHGNSRKLAEPPGNSQPPLTEDRVRQLVREELRAIQAASRAARGSGGPSQGSPG